MLLALRVPAGNDRGPLYMDQALSTVHQGNPHRLPLRLELGRHGDTIALFCRLPDELRAVVEGQLHAAYPDCTIEPLPEAHAPHSGCVWWSAEVHLKPDVFPIRRYPQFEDALNRLTADPLTALLTTLRRDAGDRLKAHIEISVRPARTTLRHRAKRCLRRLTSPFFRKHPSLAHLYTGLACSHRLPLRLFGWILGKLGRPDAGHTGEVLHVSASRLHDREEDLQAASDKVGRLLFECHIRLTITGPPGATSRALRKLREMAGGFGQFSSPRLATFHTGAVRRSTSPPGPVRSAPFLLSTEELATLWHPPTASVRTPALAVVGSRELPPPPGLPTPENYPGLAILGVATGWTMRQRCGLLPADRLRHTTLLGKTGQGKSTLLYQLITSDIAAGRGAALLDPHGDLADAVLASIPRRRTHDVVLFDAADADYPVAFNPLACADPARRPLLTSGVVSAFKKLYGSLSWGPRLEYILRQSVLALLEVPGSSLLSLQRLLSDGRYRRCVVSRLGDPVVRAFFEQEFERMPPKLQAEAVAPVQNKVGQFLSSPLLRHILGQGENRLDLRQVLDRGQVLIINLSKGRLGDDASALLGSFLVTALQLAALGRAELPEAERRDFYLYVDEFQNFATESFATILSEARKYRLGLTVANQYLGQLDEPTLHALFGNVGTLVCFQAGAKDAEILSEQLGGEVMPADLMALPRYHAYARLLVEGMPTRPFSLRTLPPSPISKAQDVAVLRRQSRRRYGRPVAEVEAEIRTALHGMP